MAKKYDFVVIGGDFGGLLCAQVLTQSGYTVAIIESKSKLGGAFHKIHSPMGDFHRIKMHIPGSPLAETVNNALADFVDGQSQFLITEKNPIAYNKGQFQTFVGWGTDTPSCLEAYDYWLTNERAEFTPALEDQLDLLITKVTETADVFLDTQITEIKKSETQITSITINDDKIIEARGFILSGPLKEWLNQIPLEGYSAKELQRLNKASLSTAIGLVIGHREPVTEATNTHVLFTNIKENNPVIGRFLTPNISSWMTFLNSEETENEEATGVAFKEIKRQIRRVYPQSLEKPVFEHIYVESEAYGQLPMKLDSQGRWLGFENLWVASGLVHPSQGLLGSLCQARLVAAAATQMMAKNMTESSTQPEANL